MSVSFLSQLLHAWSAYHKQGRRYARELSNVPCTKRAAGRPGPPRCALGERPRAQESDSSDGGASYRTLKSLLRMFHSVMPEGILRRSLLMITLIADAWKAYQQARPYAR